MAVFASYCAEHGNAVTAFFAPEGQAPITGQSFLGRGMEASAFSANTRRIRQRTVYNHGGVDNPIPFQSYCGLLFGQLFWFNHIHIVPRSYALGNLLTNQERTWDIFNGHRTTKTINSVVEAGADGFTLTNQPTQSPNFDLGALSTITVTADISTVGPVTISFSSTYTFVTGEVLTITITGNRVVIMSTEPQHNIDEAWDWFTDIITASSGIEQRISSRDVGRQRFVYRFTKEYTDLAWLENQLWAWAGNSWGIPLWTDATVLTDAITADVDFVVPVEDTTKREFRATDSENTYLALLWLDEQTFEAIEVVSFTDTTITTVNPVLNSWPAGTVVMPLRTCRIPKGYAQNNPNFGARSFEVEWEVLIPTDHADESPNPIFNITYQGIPVWDYDTYPLITGGSFKIAEDRNIREFADNLGRFSTFTDRKFPRNQFGGIRLETYGRDEFWNLRAYLSYLRGRWKAVWVSTQQADFVIESNDAAPSNTINVEEVNYTSLIWNADNGPKTRQHIEIVYLDGTIDRRQIVNAQVDPGIRETLTLDSGISQDTDQIDRISWLIRRRLSTDKITFKHRWQENEVETSSFGFVDTLDSDT